MLEVQVTTATETLQSASRRAKSGARAQGCLGLHKKVERVSGVDINLNRIPVATNIHRGIFTKPVLESSWRYFQHGILLHPDCSGSYCTAALSGVQPWSAFGKRAPRHLIS